jgi:hypothetical protein
MIEITDATLKTCIRNHAFIIQKTAPTIYLIKFNFNEIILHTVCTIKPHDIHVDFIKNDFIIATGIFRHSIVASALLNYLDKND